MNALTDGRPVTTNLTAPLWMTSLLLAGTLLRQSQGLIVNVSSGLAVYCATKAALHSVSQSLRYQLQSTPVRVVEAILPLLMRLAPGIVRNMLKRS